MKNKFKKHMFVHAKNLENNAAGCSQHTSFIDPATCITNGKFTFRIPPEAPVFEPSIEEFLDPLDYIAKIKPIAEKTGICKIKPPPEWQPPFAVDVDHFKFTPRIQKLNELDANTRVKLYFLDRLATYWNCNGVQIRIPAINDKTVDMYSLYKIVQLEGGFEVVNGEKKWPCVASRMGYDNEKIIGSALKQHYKRLLLPYEQFENKMKRADVMCADIDNKCEIKKELIKEKCRVDNDIKRRTRSNYDENETEILVSETFKNPVIQDKNKELQRLTFYGPGPKILGSNKVKSKNWKQNLSTTALIDGMCVICGNSTAEEYLLLCEGCDDSYHTYCLVPPIDCIPKGEWRCPKCIAVVVNKQNDAFGFEQAEREYTLQQFGEMADQFKSNYFNMPVHLVPTERVEHEYWRILSSMDSNVTVEYGADLHSMDHGSGFPTHCSLKECGSDSSYYKTYVESSWNLNNIPVLEGSVLGYINADISGMKIPWMYVGMCFSTFCWHNEDHWSYSINYLHWGEPKTWYGVPGSKAEDFERVMQETTPDLFHNQPDLLHQLVTILNPNILMDKGVPVYHLDQSAGEFVLTFPRAYHAGFNHGYNFAEAVNFAPVDWVPLGRMCIDHYSTLHRYCVFSHDELICKMASLPDNLNSKLASAAYEDMIKMLNCENKQRKVLLEWGVINAEREAFELLADDERQCLECNTTCFLSAVTCKCSPKKVTCLRHFKNLCKCPALEHTLKYRYTLDELPVMLNKLKEKVDSISVWAAKVHDALNVTTPRVVTLTGLKELLNEAHDKNFPDDPSLNLLSKAIKAVQDALAVDFRNILAQIQTLTKKVTVTEIKCYYDELQRIPCILPQEHIVKHFLDFLSRFRKKVNDSINNDKITISDIETLISQGNFPNIEIPEVQTLKNHLKIIRWIDEYDEMRKECRILSLDNIEKLLSSAVDISYSKRVAEIVQELECLKNKITHWEAMCDRFLNMENLCCTKPLISELEEFLKEGDRIDGLLPSRDKICHAIQSALQLKSQVCSLLSRSYVVSLSHIENVIHIGNRSVVRFEELSQMQLVMQEVFSWKRRVEELFLKNNTNLFLLDVLSPAKNVLSHYQDDIAIKNVVSTFDDTSCIDDVHYEKLSADLQIIEKRHLELVLSSRVRNINKRMRVDSKYCKCETVQSDDMKECVLCYNLFHFTCANINSNIMLCMYCERGKRPTLQVALDEVSALKNLKVHLIEGEVLKHLTESATKWKNEVNIILTDNKISRALKLVDAFENSISFHARNVETLIKDRIPILEALFIRGSAVELSMPETYTIWKLLQASKSEGRICKSDNSSESRNFYLQSINKREYLFDLSDEVLESKLVRETYAFKNELANSVVLNEEKFNSLLDSGHLDHSDELNVPSKNVGINKTRISDGNNTSSMLKSIKRRNAARYPSKTRKKSVSDIRKDNIDELENVCDLEDCIKPDADHVDWVQCDYCKCWLHMMCVGVTKKQVEMQTEFICFLCEKSVPNIFPRSHESSRFISNFNKNDDDIIFVDCSVDFSS